MTKELYESLKVFIHWQRYIIFFKAYLTLMLLTAILFSAEQSSQDQALAQLMVSKYISEHASPTTLELQCGVAKG